MNAGAINVHHHFLPPAYMKAIGDRLAPGRGTSRSSGWSPAADIEQMDAAGIELAIGSISIPGVWFGEIPAARRMAREWNEFAANVARDYPGRFGFFAVIAPPDVEGSLAEISHALDALKADGVALLSSYDGRWLGDAAFAPVMAELDRRRAVVFVHPAATREDQGPHGVKSHVLEGPFDTTRAIASLLKTDALSRHPHIQFVFAHGGGAMPYLAGRLATLNDGSEETRPENTRAQFARLYFDTALLMNEPAMAALTRFSPPSRVLLGTDSPIISTRDEMAAWRAIEVAPELRRRIERDNAVELLARFKRGVP